MTLPIGIPGAKLSILTALAQEKVDLESVSLAPWATAFVWLILLLLPWKYWSRIWAVARQTVLQAIRMKVAIVLIVFLVSLAVVLPAWLKTDQTVSGQIRIVITYTLYAAQFLLAVLTLFLSVVTLCSEIKQKQIYQLDSKPIPRWCVLAGKWVGIMVIDLFLCAVIGASLYAVVRYQARMRAIGKVEITESMPAIVKMRVEAARQDYAVRKARLLTARNVYQPRSADGRSLMQIVGERSAQEYERLKKAGRLPKKRSREWCLMMLGRGLDQSFFPVAPSDGAGPIWRITGLPTDLDPKTVLTLRFMFRGVPRPLENKIYGQWTIGRYDMDTRTFSGEGFAKFTASFKCEQPHDVHFRASAIDPKTGTVGIQFINIPQPQRPTAFFSASRGIAVLVPVGGFELNVTRAMVLIFTKLAYLSILGLFCASFLTVYVAVFAALVFSLVSAVVAHLLEIISEISLFTGIQRPGNEMIMGDVFIQKILRGVLVFFPDLSMYDPVDFLRDGLAVPWGLVAHGTVYLIAIRGGILAILGGLIFYRRELAALER